MLNKQYTQAKQEAAVAQKEIELLRDKWVIVLLNSLCLARLLAIEFMLHIVLVIIVPEK